MSSCRRKLRRGCKNLQCNPIRWQGGAGGKASLEGAKLIYGAVFQQFDLFWLNVKKYLQQFLGLLTPGVRILLGVLTLVYLVALAGKLTTAFHCDDWLSLSARQFWDGQVWRLLTYALIPAGALDLVANGFVIILLGGLLERIQSRGVLWTICLISTAGAGVAKVTLQFSIAAPLIGATPMVFGLLAAWCYLCGHEKIAVPLFGEMLVGHLALLAGAVSLLGMVISAGLSTALVMLSGSLSGWFYVWLRRKSFMYRAARTVHSEPNISRLEL
jgi:membrane associated rhomboid family serine protease